MWFKRCPQCGNYAEKSDPQECAKCTCGWVEYVAASFYCEIANRYCTFLGMEPGK
jgi:hypothetical protein